MLSSFDMLSLTVKDVIIEISTVVMIILSATPASTKLQFLSLLTSWGNTELSITDTTAEVYTIYMYAIDKQVILIYTQE